MIPSATGDSAGQAPAHRHGGRGPFIESLLLATVALAVLNFHPFGSAHLRRHFSQDLIYAWFGDADWLHPRPRGSALLGQAPPRAVVMLVDDAALALRGATWPVPAAFHAQLLTELEVLRPRAVMLDFLLLDRSPSDDNCALLAAADRLRSDRIPVYLAVTRPEDLSRLMTANCMDEAGRPLRADEVLIPVSVRRQADETDFVSRRYPFEQPDFEQPDEALERRGEGGAPGLPSAAVRIYCDTTAQPDRCLSDLARLASPQAGFELAWSPRGDPFNRRWSKAECGGTPASLRAFVDRTMFPRETGCPPIATLFASALLSPAEDAALGTNNEQLFDLIEGSTVFIGGNFRASGDLITTPMHTLLPGVYYHAVAYENLAIFDGKPKIREESRRFPLGIYLYDWCVLWALAAIFVWREKWIGADAMHHAAHHGPLSPSPSARAWAARLIARTPVALSLSLLVVASLFLAAYPVLQLWTLIAAILAAVCIEVRVASQGELEERLRNVGLYLGALGLSLTVVAFAIWFGYRWLRLPPGDWVGYLSFSTVGFFVAHTAIVDFGRHVGSIRLTRTASGGV